MELLFGMRLVLCSTSDMEHPFMNEVEKATLVRPNSLLYLCLDFALASRVLVVFHAFLFSFEVSLVKHALAVFDLTLVDCWANL